MRILNIMRIREQICPENYIHLTLYGKFICMCRVNKTFVEFIPSKKCNIVNRSLQRLRHRWVQCHAHPLRSPKVNGTVGFNVTLTPLLTPKSTIGCNGTLTPLTHFKVTGASGLDIIPSLIYMYHPHRFRAPS